MSYGHYGCYEIIRFFVFLGWHGPCNRRECECGKVLHRIKGLAMNGYSVFPRDPGLTTGWGFIVAGGIFSLVMSLAAIV